MVMSMSDEPHIAWPPKFEPEQAPIHVRNELDSNCEPGRLFAWLIRAGRWPEWYTNSRNVQLPEGALDLRLGMQFRWRTFGVSLVSVVEEFVPNERIAWSARGAGVLAYHAWLIQPRQGGSSILTEETQYGWLSRLGHWLAPNRMSEGHDQWLRSLDRMAASGPPGACRLATPRSTAFDSDR